VQPLAQLSPGAAFGLAALHERQGRMASCVASSACTVLALNEVGWQRLVRDDSPIGSCFRRAMIDVLSKQLAATNLQLAAINSEPSRLGAALGAYEGGSGV
jgi:CRP-like cAMP-binding protein